MFSGYLMNQAKYVTNLFSEFCRLDAMSILTPLDPHDKLTLDIDDLFPDSLAAD